MTIPYVKCEPNALAYLEWLRVQGASLGLLVECSIEHNQEGYKKSTTVTARQTTCSIISDSCNSPTRHA